MNSIQENLSKIGVSLINSNTGKYRSLEDVMIDVAKAFNDLKIKNKTETNQDIIKEREKLIDDTCYALAGGFGIRDKTKNKYEIKSLLLKL
jgi:hypothetical protein